MFIRSIFCLNPAGDTPSSARLFDAIVSGCIPVIVSDELELPFEGILDYRKVYMCLLLWRVDHAKNSLYLLEMVMELIENALPWTKSIF